MSSAIDRLVNANYTNAKPMDSTKFVDIIDAIQEVDTMALEVRQAASTLDAQIKTILSTKAPLWNSHLSFHDGTNKDFVTAMISALNSIYNKEPYKSKVAADYNGLRTYGLFVDGGFDGIVTDNTVTINAILENG